MKDYIIIIIDQFFEKSTYMMADFFFTFLKTSIPNYSNESNERFFLNRQKVH